MKRKRVSDYSPEGLTLIGRLVKVETTGGIYTTYNKMFEALGFRDTKKNDVCLREGEILKVFNTGIHCTTGALLLACTTVEGLQLLIGADAVSFPSTELFMPDRQTFRLNDSYVATIRPEDNFVEVGCQTFSFNSILGLADLIKELKQSLT